MGVAGIAGAKVPGLSEQVIDIQGDGSLLSQHGLGDFRIEDGLGRHLNSVTLIPSVVYIRTEGKTGEIPGPYERAVHAVVPGLPVHVLVEGIVRLRIPGASAETDLEGVASVDESQVLGYVVVPDVVPCEGRGTVEIAEIVAESHIVEVTVHEILVRADIASGI